MTRPPKNMGWSPSVIGALFAAATMAGPLSRAVVSAHRRPRRCCACSASPRSTRSRLLSIPWTKAGDASRWSSPQVLTPTLAGHLNQLGCETGQGFFFAPPMEADRLLDFLVEPTRAQVAAVPAVSAAE